jgi:hypothetical protein
LTKRGRLRQVASSTVGGTVRLKSKKLKKDADLAELLEQTPRWVRSHRKNIPHYKLVGSYRYDFESPEFLAWLEAHKGGVQ